MDSGTPVDDKDYQVPFHFTGKLAELTVKVMLMKQESSLLILLAMLLSAPIISVSPAQQATLR